MLKLLFLSMFLGESFSKQQCEKYERLPMDKSRKELTYPWKDVGSQRCKRLKTRFILPEVRPRVALATYPGSGNTWTRHLIEGLTGVFTGDVYNDTLLDNTFMGTREDHTANTTFVIKTHSPV